MATARSFRGRVFAIAIALGGCFDTNPHWDGPVAGSSGGSTGSSSSTGTDASTSSTGMLDPSSSDADATDAMTTLAEVVDAPVHTACTVEPEPVGDGCFVCDNSCSDGICAIECIGERACENRLIVCPPGWPCQVDCVGKEACRRTVIACSSEYACRIACDGDKACEESIVACGGGVCELACTGHALACEKLRFACGAGDGAITCEVPQETPPTMAPALGSACACEHVGC